MDRTAGRKRKGWSFFLQMPRKLYFIIIKVLGFLLFFPFREGGKTASRAQEPARLWDCSTEMPWPHPDSLGGRWLELQICSMLVVGKVLHFRTARLREKREKIAILSRQQNTCICAKHILWVVGSTNSRLSFERDNSRRSTGHTHCQVFPAPWIFLHPSEHWAWTKFICREREDGTSYKILQKESSVISSPSRNKGAGCSYGKCRVLAERTKTPAAGIWHLSTGQENRTWIPGRWTGSGHWNCS